MLGSQYLHDVRPHHIREFMNRKDKELSRSSIGKLHQILSGAFKEAWRNGLIPDNPVAKTPRLAPKAQRPIDALSMDRVQQIIAESEAKGDRWHVLYRLLGLHRPAHRRGPRPRVAAHRHLGEAGAGAPVDDDGGGPASRMGTRRGVQGQPHRFPSTTR